MNTTPKNILEEAEKEFNLTPPNPMNMLDITNDQCKYPLGDEKDKPELFCGKQHEGAYNVMWDGKNQSGSAVAAGTYIYEVQVDQSTLTKKMILLK